jgi:methionyl-tRNA formyltransferase
MQMDTGIDTGDMLLQKGYAIPEGMTAGELHDVLSDLGAGTLTETIDLLQQGKLSPQKQDDTQASHAPMLSKDMSPIDFSRTASEVQNQVRGLNPWPGATMDFNGTTLKVHRVRVHDTGDSPLHIRCGDGKYIELMQVQQAGKKTMPAEEFLRGRR